MGLSDHDYFECVAAHDAAYRIAVSQEFWATPSAFKCLICPDGAGGFFVLRLVVRMKGSVATGADLWRLERVHWDNLLALAAAGVPVKIGFVEMFDEWEGRGYGCFPISDALKIGRHGPKDVALRPPTPAPAEVRG